MDGYDKCPACGKTLPKSQICETVKEAATCEDFLQSPNLVTLQSKVNGSSRKKTKTS